MVRRGVHVSRVRTVASSLIYSITRAMYLHVPAKDCISVPMMERHSLLVILTSNPQPPSKNEIELKEKEATQKKRLKEVKIATRRHKIPLPHNAT